MIATRKYRVVDLRPLVLDLLHQCRKFCRCRPAVPKIACSNPAAEVLPAPHGLIHAGIGLGIALAYHNPEIFILERFHLNRIPLTGHQVLRGKKLRIFITDGNIRHAPLRLSRTIDTILVHTVAVHYIKQQI